MKIDKNQHFVDKSVKVSSNRPVFYPWRYFLPLFQNSNTYDNQPNYHYHKCQVETTTWPISPWYLDKEDANHTITWGIAPNQTASNARPYPESHIRGFEWPTTSTCQKRVAHQSPMCHQCGHSCCLSKHNKRSAKGQGLVKAWVHKGAHFWVLSMQYIPSDIACWYMYDMIPLPLSCIWERNIPRGMAFVCNYELLKIHLLCESINEHDNGIDGGRSE